MCCITDLLDVKGAVASYKSVLNIYLTHITGFGLPADHHLIANSVAMQLRWYWIGGETSKGIHKGEILTYDAMRMIYGRTFSISISLTDKEIRFEVY